MEHTTQHSEFLRYGTSLFSCHDWGFKASAFKIIWVVVTYKLVEFILVGDCGEGFSAVGEDEETISTAEIGFLQLDFT